MESTGFYEELRKAFENRRKGLPETRTIPIYMNKSKTGISEETMKKFSDCVDEAVFGFVAATEELPMHSDEAMKFIAENISQASRGTGDNRQRAFFRTRDKKMIVTISLNKVPSTELPGYYELSYLVTSYYFPPKAEVLGNVHPTNTN